MASSRGILFKAMKIGAMAAIAICLMWVAEVSASSPPSPVRLASGLLPKFRWWMDAYKGRTPRIPCLHIELTRRGKHSPVADVIDLGETSCRSVSPLPNAFGIVDELDHPKVTVIGMAFPKTAYAVSLYFQGPLKDRTIQLKLQRR
jgi:hypothetical protein